ncbi:tetratricopeptide repeat protein [Streptosporangium sp. KLBMP 9127]|nr:tetratricopeptide repeat protein [Streptosporangium sp. KLBMP 9127]
MDDEHLTRSLGYQEWSVIYGPVSPVPEIQRNDILQEILDSLSKTDISPTKPKYCILAGLSGIGKSSIASSFVAKYADQYQVVFWIDASSVDTIYTGYLHIRNRLSGSTRAAGVDDGVDSIRQQVHDALRQIPDSWLIVFDDATLSTAREWLPRAGKGQVLVTSTDSAGWRPIGNTVSVPLMTEGEAVELAFRRLSVDETQQPFYANDIKDLVKTLENWPLAIELACGYIESCEISLTQISDYLALVKERALDDTVSIPLGYPRTLVAAIMLGLQRIHELLAHNQPFYSITIEMLRAACYFSPNQIPLHLLAVSAFAPVQSIADNGRGAVVVDEAEIPIREIVRVCTYVSFVRYSKPLSQAIDKTLSGATLTITMNTVLQDVLRSRFEPITEIERTLPQACYHVERWLTVAMETGRSDLSWEIAQHASTLISHAQRLEVKVNETAHLIGNLGGFHHSHGQHDMARTLLELEIAWLEEIAEPNEFLAVQARILLASTLRSIGAASDEQIIQHLERVLDFVEELPHSADNGASAATYLGTQVVIFLEHLEPATSVQGQVLRLLNSFRAIISSLPTTPASEFLVGMSEVGRLISSDACAQAESRSRELLAMGVAPLSQEVELRRLLIESLCRQSKWQLASAELEEIRPYVGGRSLFRFSVEVLTHNVGLNAAIAWLVADDEEASDLLLKLVELVDIAELMRTVSPHDHARFALLDAVAAAKRMDAPSFSSALKRIDYSELKRNRSQSNAVWISLLDGIQNKLSRDFMLQESNLQRESSLLERPTFGVPLESADSLLRSQPSPEEIREMYEQTDVAAAFFLTSDPEFSRTSFSRIGDGAARLKMERPSTYPVAFLEPRYFIGLTRTTDGGSIEGQIEAIGRTGFFILSSEFLFIRMAHEWGLGEESGKLVLRDSGGGIWAETDALPSAQWRRMARTRGRVIVLYGFGFELHNRPESSRRFSPEDFSHRFADAASKGFIAAASIEWREAPPHSFPRLSMDIKPQAHRSRKKRRRKR